VNNMSDIHKVAGVLLRDGKLLVAREEGKDTFMIPGGKIDEGENKEETLIRELKEELSVDVIGKVFLDTFRRKAHGKDCDVVMYCYFVDHVGDIKANSEIEDLRWVGKDSDVPIGSVIKECIIPKLVEMDLM